MLHMQLTMTQTHTLNSKVSIPVILCGPITTKIFSMLITVFSLVSSAMTFKCMFFKYRGVLCGQIAENVYFLRF